MLQGVFGMHTGTGPNLPPLATGHDDEYVRQSLASEISDVGTTDLDTSDAEYAGALLQHARMPMRSKCRVQAVSRVATNYQA